MNVWSDLKKGQNILTTVTRYLATFENFREKLHNLNLFCIQCIILQMDSAYYGQILS